MTFTPPNPKPIIGLVGGIGAGKSTVARLCAEQGCAVISADELNHQLLREPEIIATLVGWWGPDLLNDQGLIDRRRLGQRVFDDPSAMQHLTDLVHPEIRRRQDRLIEQYQGDDRYRAIVLDAPLLLEAGWQDLCDHVVFVQADDSVRRRRVRRRSGWGKYQTKNAENLQLALDTKAQMSDYIVHNNSGIPELSVQVAKMLSQFCEGNAL